MKDLLTAMIVTVLTACSETQPKVETKTIDFGSFTIETPQAWTAIKEKGTDSYVGRISIDDTDTLEFDLGWYSNDLTEYQEVKMGDGRTYYISSYDTASSPTLVDSADKEKVVKSKISWDTLSGRQVKIISPIKPGIGTTGIYIDSLWRAGSDVDKFNLYGNNLKPQNNKAVLAAFRTLKFNNRQ